MKYAIKITDLSKFDEEERSYRLKHYQKELDLLQKIESRFVTKYHGKADN